MANHDVAGIFRLPGPNRRHAARRDVRAGILRSSRGSAGSASASGRHVSFSDPINDNGGAAAKSPKANSPKNIVKESALLPKPQLLGVNSGPPKTHTVLAGGLHVPRKEEWLGESTAGWGGVSCTWVDCAWFSA